MPLESAPSQIATAPRHRIAQVLLLILALFETYPARIDLWILVDDLSQASGPSLSWITTAVVALSPVATAAALVFAPIGRVRHAIVAIAVLGLLGWLNYKTSFTLAEMVLGVSSEAFVTLLQLIVFPAISVAAIWLAVRNERIGLAALMASTSVVFSQLSAIFFTIVVTIFGI